MSSGLFAVSLGSSCRTEPAAVLRGFAYVGRPAASRSSLKRSNADLGNSTSPRASNLSGTSPITLRGTDLTVLRFRVTSSPTVPLPRVAPLTSMPFSYVKATARPSYFSSQTMSKASVSSRVATRRCHATSSSSLNALPRLSIGTGCSACTKLSAGSAPTRWVGESGVTSSGFASSISRRLPEEGVVLGVAYLGPVEYVVEVVVAVELVAQRRGFRFYAGVSHLRFRWGFS